LIEKPIPFNANHIILHRIGIISDTHGLLRPEALAELQGCDRILHAGDIGTPEVLQQLHELTPATAVRGNNDKGRWTEGLPVSITLSIRRVGIYPINDLAELSINPASTGISIVVSGHTHKPAITERNGVRI